MSKIVDRHYGNTVCEIHRSVIFMTVKGQIECSPEEIPAPSVNQGKDLVRTCYRRFFNKEDEFFELPIRPTARQ